MAKKHNCYHSLGARGSFKHESCRPSRSHSPYHLMRHLRVVPFHAAALLPCFCCELPGWTCSPASLCLVPKCTAPAVTGCQRLCQLLASNVSLPSAAVVQDAQLVVRLCSLTQQCLLAPVSWPLPSCLISKQSSGQLHAMLLPAGICGVCRS